MSVNAARRNSCQAAQQELDLIQDARRGRIGPRRTHAKPLDRSATDHLTMAAAVSISGEDLRLGIVRQAAHDGGGSAMAGQPFSDVGAEWRRAYQLRPE